MKLIYRSLLLIGAIMFLSINSFAIGLAATSNLFAKAEALVKTAKYDDAIAVYDTIIKGGNNMREAQVKKGDCLVAQKKYIEAIRCWEEILTKHEMLVNNDVVVLRIAKTYSFSLNQSENGILWYQKLLGNSKNSAILQEATYQYAGLYFNMREYLKSLELFRNYSKKYPGSEYTDAVNGYIASCSNRLKTIESAEKVKNTVLKPISKTAEKFKGAEEIYNRKYYSKALIEYRAIANDSLCKERDISIFRIGQCHRNIGEYKLAIDDWTSLLKINITNCVFADQVLFEIGETYFIYLADIPNSLKAHTILCSTFTNSTFYLLSLKRIGMIHLYKGELDQASCFFRLVAQINKEQNENDNIRRLLLFCVGNDSRILPNHKSFSQNEQAITYAKLGDILFIDKDYSKALVFYNRSLTKAVDEEDIAYATMQKGRCLRQLERFEEALKCYGLFKDKYLLSQYRASVLMRTAEIYCGPFGDTKSAISIYETILTDLPSDCFAEQAFLMIASIAYWNKEWVKASDMHNKFVALYPNSPFVKMVLNERMPLIYKKLKKEGKLSE